MDADATLEPGMTGDPASAVDPWSTFDRWCQNLFGVMAVLSAFAVLVVVSAAARIPLPLIGVMAAAVLVSVAVLYAVMFAIRDRRPWARDAASLILYVTVLAGGVQAAMDLVSGRFPIPLGMLMALAVLAKRPREHGTGSPGRGHAVALGAVFLAAQLAPGLLSLALV